MTFCIRPFCVPCLDGRPVSPSPLPERVNFCLSGPRAHGTIMPSLGVRQRASGKRSNVMIPARVEQLFLSNMGFVVLLKGEADERSLPIFIGAAEAQAIALWINKIHVPRPLTHDLFKNVLDCLEARLVRIVVTDLKEGTFYAKLILAQNRSELEMDARPSDAIALALRADCPIFVDEKVMDEAGRVFEENRDGLIEKPVPGGTAGSTSVSLTPIEALEKDLQKAVDEERYEDAAKLRDRIKHLKESHTKN